MNLITCNEDCKYQHDGYCKLNKNAAINSIKVNGCSYFIKRKPLKKDKEGSDSK